MNIKNKNVKEVEEVAVRLRESSFNDVDDDEDEGENEEITEEGEEEEIWDVLHSQQLLLEQLGNELNLIVTIIMAMDGRFDDMKDEMENRFQEEDYRFEVAFDELSLLGKRRRTARG